MLSLTKNTIKNLLIVGTAFLSTLLFSLPANSFSPGEIAQPVIICQKSEALVDAVKLRDSGADDEGLEIINAMIQRGQCVRNIFNFPMEVGKSLHNGKDISVYEILDLKDKSVVYYTLGAGPKGQHQI